jgi:hypothetical protein
MRYHKRCIRAQFVELGVRERGGVKSNQFIEFEYWFVRLPLTSLHLRYLATISSSFEVRRGPLVRLELLAQAQTRLIRGLYYAYCMNHMTYMVCPTALLLPDLRAMGLSWLGVPLDAYNSHQ